ncbi:MAG: OmpH family outer membrane protein [Candidatus Xenobiia bacterium LiM19]
MKRASILYAMVALFALLIIAGCAEKKEPVIAYIDTDQMLIKWEKYKDYGDAYIKERQEWTRRLSDPARKTTAADQVEFTKSMEKWDAKMKEIRDEIREAATKVAKDKKYAVIIDNATTSPVIEAGGVDVTVEVLKELRNRK